MMLCVWHVCPSCCLLAIPQPCRQCGIALSSGELLGSGSLLPEAIVLVQPMPASPQQLYATVMWHQRPLGSGQPHGCGCQACRVASGLAERPLVPASGAPTAFGGFVPVLVFQPFVGIFCSQGQPLAEPGEERRESPLPASLLT